MALVPYNHEQIPGIEFDFGGGRVRVIPPLALGALQRMQKKLAAFTVATSMEPESIATVIEAAHSALKRNYPEITEEEVGDLVDLGNMHDVIGCVMDVAGVRRKAIEEEKNRKAQPAETPPPTGQG